MKQHFHSIAMVTIAAICCVLSFVTGCKKREKAATAVTPVNHASKLAHPRHWQAYQYHNYTGTNDTTYANADTLFTITALDDNRINFLGDTLLYNDTLSSSARWVFSAVAASNYGPTLNSAASVTYYTAADSAVYYFKSNVMNHFDYRIYSSL